MILVRIYLMLLLHDIGKSEGIKQHDVNGVHIAQPILKRFEISEEQQEQVLFIIWHPITILCLIMLASFLY